MSEGAWLRVRCGRTPCGQRVNAASGRVDKPGTTRSGGLPTLPTLIHPLPTLRRAESAVGRECLRRDCC